MVMNPPVLMEEIISSDINKRKSRETEGNTRKKAQIQCLGYENSTEISPQPPDVCSKIFQQSSDACCSAAVFSQSSNACCSAVVSPQPPDVFSKIISQQPSDACCSAVVSPQSPDVSCSVIYPLQADASCSAIMSTETSDACDSAVIPLHPSDACSSTIVSLRPPDDCCSAVISPPPSEAFCSADTVDNVLEDMEEEIDNALEKPCHKNKLSSKNVKSILRHIIANEYVLNMVQSTMNPSELAYEPNLTRSKAKEMRKKQVSLPWPVASPAKTVKKVSKIILEEEFPDESSGDEDYKPNEEECHSDEDGTSKKGTSSRAQSLSSSPAAKVVEPMSEEENALVIALPELDVPPDSSEEDKIALRTRSKLCLNDTPLEEIEASLIAPDITMDMYAVYCDDKDWQSFLCELNKSTDTSAVLDYADDAENDPEYNDPEEVVPDYDDLLDEEITPDEWNDLMAGNLELAQEDLSFLDDEDEEEEPRISMKFLENPEVNLGPVCVDNVDTVWMTSDERLQLDEQMRMYVQLVSQSYLLTHENSALQSFNASTKIILEEIKMFATRQMTCEKNSAFYAHNLDGALEIVNEFEKINLPINLKDVKQPKRGLPPVPHHVQSTLATNKVFIYPELLPTCGFRNIVDMCKTFNTPEDNLISLGLEEFSVLQNTVECIQKFLIPTKSVEQINYRIKNCRLKKDDMANSITYYYMHYQAPTFQRVIRIFDPNNIKAPENFSPEFLPKWMEPYSKLSSCQPVSFPTQSTKPSSKVTTGRSTFRKAHHRRKYVHILPRGLNFSSFVPPRPFLRKYSQRRHKKQIRKVPLVPHPWDPKPGSSNLKLNVVNSEFQKILNGTDLRNVKYLSSSVSAESKICSTSEKSDISIVNYSEALTCSVILNFKSDEKEKSICKSPSVSPPSKENFDINQVSEKTHKDGKKLKAFVDKATSTKDKSSVASIDKTTKNRKTSKRKGKSGVFETKTTCTNVEKQLTCKTRSQHQRDLDASLALLQPTVVKDVSTKEREVMFANSYLLRATEILKDDPEVCKKFLLTLSKYHQSKRSPVELYLELKDTLKDYPALVRDSIVLLRPEQAKECGRYKEHIALNKTREFFKKIEIHFKNEPQLINQIVIKFAQLQEKVDITTSEMIKALQPLLKNQTSLLKELNNLLSSPK